MIVNRHATSANGPLCDLVARSLAGLVDLEIVRTQYRGHARELAAATNAELVIVLGGDGSVNEVVNGLMSHQAPRPRLAVIPAGGGNVLARGLGLPSDANAAIHHVREVIESGKYRTIGLGLAGDRYFTFSAGLGWDAEVVGEVERQRIAGRKESATLFLRTMTRTYIRGTDRRRPALTLERDGASSAGQLFMCIVTNRSPWTYLRGRALLPVPDPDFNSGLDVLALRRLHYRTVLGVVGQMLWVRRRSPRGRDLLSAHGLESMTLRSVRPIAFQVDGEYLGETEAVKFQFVPDALQVVA
jgi:diacylglycerol kinase family enzyme